jgi:hypothetical protein
MDQIYSQMHILTSYCGCGAQWFRIAESKSTKFRLRASDQRARAFSTHSLQRTNTYINGAVLHGSV